MSIIDKKSMGMFNKIDTVHGHCEECGEEAIHGCNCYRLLQMHKLWSRHQATYQWLY